MLRLIREKVRGPIIKFGLGFVILAFIVTIFYAWGVGGTGGKRTGEPIAVVNGYKISAFQFRKKYDSKIQFYRRFYPQGLDEKTKERLKKEAFNELIEYRLALDKALEYKMRVTNRELQDRIRKYPAFQEDGNFSFEGYSRWLKFQELTPSDFEEMIREGILVEKLESFIKSNANVSLNQLKNSFRDKHEKIKVKYVSFSPKDMEKDIKPLEKDLKEYYEAHKNDFKTKEKVKVGYLYYAADKFANDEVSEEEIENYYDAHIADYETKKKIRFRQILLKSAENTKTDTVDAEKEINSEKNNDELKKKAEEIRKKATAKEDFKDLVKKFSQDERTLKKDGDMGFFEESQIMPALRSAFSLKLGEVSEPLKSSQGFHILKVEEIKEAGTKPLSETKQSITRKLSTEKSKDNAYERAAQDSTDIMSGKPMKEIAQDKRVTHTVTEFFDKEGRIKGVGRNRKFMDAAFGTPIEGISSILELNNGFYILEKLEKKDPEVMSFKDGQKKIEKQYISEKAKELAKERAEAFHKETVAKKKNFQEIAQEYKFEVKESKDFARNGYVPNIGSMRNISNQLFSLNKGEISGVIKEGRGFYVFVLESKEEADMKNFENEKEKLLTSVASREKEDFFSVWMDDVRNKANIKINEDML